MFDRTRLFTWEQLHEITAPYCIRGESTYPTITYKWWYIHRLRVLFCYPEVWGRSWYKRTITNLWMN